jgi:Uma2 family endonuclease
MSEAARRRATYEDLLAVPETQVAEIVAGELHATPRPAGPHSLAASTLAAEIGGAFLRGRGGPGGWWIIVEPELHLGPDVLVPDLAGWRRDRLPIYPEEAFVEVAPDWVCEVLSPRTLMLDRVRKLPAYAREGVAHAWLVDPVARTLEVFRLQTGSWMLVSAHAGDEEVRAVPFEAFTLPLPALWNRGP